MRKHVHVIGVWKRADGGYPAMAALQQSLQALWARLRQQGETRRDIARMPARITLTNHMAAVAPEVGELQAAVRVLGPCW